MHRIACGVAKLEMERDLVIPVAIDDVAAPQRKPEEGLHAGSDHASLAGPSGSERISATSSW